MPFMYTSATADLGILEGRLTAARAAALDELLPANIPTDLTDLYIDTQVIVNQRLTAARAAALDELLAANIPTDLTNIEADTAGLAGAAMRGTDAGLLAANYLGHQMTHYAYGGNLAQNTSFIPPSGTVVTLAHIAFTVIAANDWFFWIGATGNVVVDAFNQDEGDLQRGINAWMVCDGTDGFRNNTAGAQDILLRGVTLA